MWQDFYVPGARTKAQGSASCLWQVMPKHWCSCVCVYVCVVVVVVVLSTRVRHIRLYVLILTPEPIATAVATASLDNPSCIPPAPRDATVITNPGYRYNTVFSHRNEIPISPTPQAVPSGPVPPSRAVRSGGTTTALPPGGWRHQALCLGSFLRRSKRDSR
jgi:hypothetical protein